MDRFDSKVIERVLKTTKFAAPELKQNNIYLWPPVSQWRLNIKEKNKQPIGHISTCRLVVRFQELL